MTRVLAGPLRGLEGVPGLPGTPQEEAGLTRKFETSHVGGATCRTPPIPRSALEKDPRPGPLFEATLWGKAQEEGVRPPPCIVRKDPRVPHLIKIKDPSLG